MRFALAGNPNSGKTTLFNRLTGGAARVGNWPGVTVDKKEGICKYSAGAIAIVDLPGIYSLSPYTPEEVVARNYIIEENPELVINIVDATNLERNLYLSTQLLETETPLVIALNMIDAADSEGLKIDPQALSGELGVPVVPISALTGRGVADLIETACRSAAASRKASSVLEHSAMGGEFRQIVNLLAEKEVEHPVFHAVKLLEGDKLETDELKNRSGALSEEITRIKSAIKLDAELENDFAAAVADARYKYISGRVRRAVAGSRTADKLTASDKIDLVLTNKILGIPMFLFFMYIVFHLTFSNSFLWVEGLPSPGVWLQGLTEDFMSFLSAAALRLLTEREAAEWARGLLVDGVLAGIGAILSFLPQILMLFLFLSIMEDSGYMARAAFLMDKPLRRFGLSGKAFLPMLMGFGCSVPAMLGTRVLESEKERHLAIMLMPFFSCGAKLPIWAMFSAAIFPDSADLAVFAVYTGGIAVAAVTAVILNRTVWRGETTPFIMELPSYRMPGARSLLLHLWEKLKGFVVRASTVIAGATVVIWFLSNFNLSLSMVEANSAGSILGLLGGAVAPFFAPLGFAGAEDSWKAVVAVLTGLIAKEMVISTMGILYNPGIEGDALADENAGALLTGKLAEVFTPLSAASFMMFNLLSIPCMAAVAAANAELRGFKRLAGVIFLWLFTAWSVAFLIFNIGSFIGWR
ncbi:MAG: ferrous iron transport protein B [Acidaminococcales bacterium]|jgi:ferrous iron transport protein B|nr:ferrous iron transport protein B [Acidaminococcales bacterium]